MQRDAVATPVAFFIYKRPALTRRVLSAIARVRPRRLFVAADGPRDASERDLCQETRALLDELDWECHVERDYADTNLGCAVRESSAIDWVFSRVDEAIFLEDDTLPGDDFFYFAQELLGRYREDKRIMHISGNNYQQGSRPGAYSYYYSRYSHNSGWATWKRAWRYYDFRMRSWPEFSELGLLQNVLEDPVEHEYWRRQFDDNFREPSSYDHQWLYTVWAQGGLAVLPDVNLVSNIGFGGDATHTREWTPAAEVPIRRLGELRHPPFVVHDKVADRYTFDHVFGGAQMRQRHFRRWLVARLPGRAQSWARRLRRGVVGR